jgi:hypothetical protein
LFLSIPMCIGKPRHREEELTLTREKGAATEPLDGGARTYGCTHAPARGPEGRRFILSSAHAEALGA